MRSFSHCCFHNVCDISIHPYFTHISSQVKLKKKINKKYTKIRLFGAYLNNKGAYQSAQLISTFVFAA